MQGGGSPPFYVYARVYHTEKWEEFELHCRKMSLQNCGKAQDPACNYIVSAECTLKGDILNYNGDVKESDLRYNERAEFNITSAVCDFECGPREVIAANRHSIMNAILDKFSSLCNWRHEKSNECNAYISPTKKKQDTSKISKLMNEKKVIRMKLNHLKRKTKTDESFIVTLRRLLGGNASNQEEATLTSKLEELTREIKSLNMINMIAREEGKREEEHAELVKQRELSESIKNNIDSFWENTNLIEYTDPSHFYWLYKNNFCRVNDDCHFVENLRSTLTSHGPSYIVQIITSQSPFPHLPGGKIDTESRISRKIGQHASEDFFTTEVNVGSRDALFTCQEILIAKVHKFQESLSMAVKGKCTDELRAYLAKNHPNNNECNNVEHHGNDELTAAIEELENVIGRLNVCINHRHETVSILNKIGTEIHDKMMFKIKEDIEEAERVSDALRLKQMELEKKGKS